MALRLFRLSQRRRHIFQGTAVELESFISHPLVVVAPPNCAQGDGQETFP